MIKNKSIAVISTLIIIVLVVLAIITNNQFRNDSNISYPTSLLNNSSESIPEYSVELKKAGDFYIAEYTRGNVIKEIYKWKADLGYGIGGDSCTGIKYSPDKAYFVACVSTAVVADHQWIPLVFDSNGNLVIDFAKVMNFPFSQLKDVSSSYTSSDILYPISEYTKSFEWLDAHTLVFEIYNKDLKAREKWKFSIGDNLLTRI